MRLSFQEELNRLEAHLQEESDLVLRSLRGALNALEQQDAELADEVIAFDDEVDDRYLSIGQGIEQLLARQTPVAVDLRLVLAILHNNLGLERMADLCVTISKLTKLSADLPTDEALVEAFEEMGSRAEEMIRVAMRSFAERDLAGAETLVDLDELIDRANRRVVEHILDFGADPGAPRVGYADDRRLPVSRADRRPRRRHRRADRVPHHRRVPRVHRRLASGAVAPGGGWPRPRTRPMFVYVAARPTEPAGRPPTAPSESRLPSELTSNAPISGTPELSS